MTTRIKNFSNAKITQVELNDFRELYATLVYDLWRDPIDAIQMIAIWIWLGQAITGLPNRLTLMILTLPSQLINKIGDEALSIWACIDNVHMLLTMNFRLTNILLKKEMPIELFCKYREFSIAGINDVVTVVCANCLKDIWDGAIARNAYMEFLHKKKKSSRDESEPDERTLFVTFSRGYPVAEWEVTKFLTGLFGDCIESFYMEEVAEGEHALFAKIVLNHTSYVNLVLSGHKTAKFTINGRHVWMRKFIPKSSRA
ncbi:uncharacterized protein [Rutidosis leptorrhynchoides]|uniref:uncharacterized protein n=1 Tax=Rutidosis leptorrhynchoides TaxID=125765 RepID=UPI003A99C546